MTNELGKAHQALVAIASLEAKGDLVALASAIHRGLDDGLTIRQIKEALSHLHAYTGFPRSLNALGVLQQVLKEREAKGIKDTPGKEADPLPRGYNALRQGTAVQTKLVGQAYDYTFAPEMDYYLKAHLFGDIFARNSLTPAERELVTLSALSALRGAEAQLRSHVRGARNMGLPEASIRMIPEVLARGVGQSEAYRLRRAIAEASGEPFTEGEPIEGQVFPTGELNTIYAQYFSGNSYLAPLAQEGGLRVANVTFEPACRNNWHIHHGGGQILIAVGGRGWYQEAGKPAQPLKPGDVVHVAPGVKHWHGAASDSWFQHIALSVPAEGARTEWLEPVPVADYEALKWH